MSGLKDVSLKDVGLKDVSLKDVVVPTLVWPSDGLEKNRPIWQKSAQLNLN